MEYLLMTGGQAATRKPQRLQLVRAQCSRVEIVNHWFIECLKPVLDRLNLHESPSRIFFNVSEVGFPLSGRVGNVFVKRGIKSPQALIPGSGRDNISVQTCCSTSGEPLQPYIVFAGQRLQYNNCASGGPLGTRYSVSSRQGQHFWSGWSHCFFHHFLMIIAYQCCLLSKDICHTSYEVWILARENGIHLLKLPPHPAHILHAASGFGSL